jgi:hypothetical protein
MARVPIPMAELVRLKVEDAREALRMGSSSIMSTELTLKKCH